MCTRPAHPRRGMTLVELLVVVTILLLLAVTVLPNISGTIDSRRFREAARNVSTFIARSQSRALLAPSPRGLIIQPMASQPTAAIDLYFASSPEPYTGEWPDSGVVLPPEAYSSNLTPRVPVFFRRGRVTDNETLARLRLSDMFADGDTIQFGSGAAQYRLFISPLRNGGGDPFIQMLQYSGQTPRNLAWPVTDSTNGTAFRVHPQPRRASSGSLQLQRGAAIDLAWSCLGTRPLGAMTPLPPIVTDFTKPMAITFDSSGKPSELIHSGGLRTELIEPLFLLVGSSELAGNAFDPTAGSSGSTPDDARVGTNWQQRDAVWLSLDNHTGTIRFANVAPNSTTVGASQRFIRLAVEMGVSER